MKFEQINPPEYLREYVHFYWTLESSLEDISTKTFRLIADGSPGIFIHQPFDGGFYQNQKKMPPLCLYGQTTQPAKLISSGKIKALGAFLFPHTLQSIFGLPADQLTDTCLDLDLLTKKSDPFILEKLSGKNTGPKQIEILSTFLKKKIENKPLPTDHKIKYAVTEIIKKSGNISLKHLQKDLGISEKSLQRNFKKSIGVSPKLYARICQFRASLNQIETKKFERLSDIAYDNDYSDQSHFIRSFRQFAGFSPKHFPAKSEEVFEVLTKINQ